MVCVHPGVEQGLESVSSLRPVGTHRRRTVERAPGSTPGRRTRVAPVLPAGDVIEVTPPWLVEINGVGAIAVAEGKLSPGGSAGLGARPPIRRRGTRQNRADASRGDTPVPSGPSASRRRSRSPPRPSPADCCSGAPAFLRRWKGARPRDPRSLVAPVAATRGCGIEGNRQVAAACEACVRKPVAYSAVRTNRKGPC